MLIDLTITTIEAFELACEATGSEVVEKKEVLEGIFSCKVRFKSPQQIYEVGVYQTLAEKQIKKYENKTDSNGGKLPTNQQKQSDSVDKKNLKNK